MKFSKSTVITVVVLLAILLIAGWYALSVKKQQSEQELFESSAAKVFESNASSTPFTDFYGNTANLEQYLGKVLIVNSWASWSPASAEELKSLARIALNYEADEVIVLAINRNENTRTAEQYLKTLGIASQVHLIVDEDDRYYKSIGGKTMPETMIYDRKGDEVAHIRGKLSADKAAHYIGQALAQPTD